jgi:hypothetical protein
MVVRERTSWIGIGMLLGASAKPKMQSIYLPITTYPMAVLAHSSGAFPIYRVEDEMRLSR